MTIEDRIKAAEEAVRLADRAYLDLDKAFRGERDEAVRVVREKHAPAMDAAKAVIRQAGAALVDAKEATPPHPWTGKKVYQMQATGRIGRNTKRVEGIVEMRTRASVFPVNAKWGLPGFGEPFVRLLKSDGTVGLRFEPFKNSFGYFWKLADADEANSAES